MVSVLSGSTQSSGIRWLKRKTISSTLTPEYRPTLGSYASRPLAHSFLSSPFTTPVKWSLLNSGNHNFMALHFTTYLAKAFSAHLAVSASLVSPLSPWLSYYQCRSQPLCDTGRPLLCRLSAGSAHLWRKIWTNICSLKTCLTSPTLSSWGAFRYRDGQLLFWPNQMFNVY
jgi:hypothetical protein